MHESKTFHESIYALSHIIAIYETPYKEEIYVKPNKSYIYGLTYMRCSVIKRSQNYVNGLAAGGLPRFSPLLSQPLVEFCLGVPTWVWCAGGINRAPARTAFAADLPRAILERVSKAGPDSFVRSIFDRHRRTYRDLLLEGLLARHGLIEREAVEAAFNVDFRS